MKSGKYMLLVSLMAAAALVISGCCHKTPEQRAEKVVQHLVSTLKLDAAQTTKLEKMKEEFLAKRPDMVKMREESMKDIKELMTSAQIDQIKLNAQIEKMQAHTSDMIRFVSAKFVELHDLLTPEQRNKLAEELGKHAERMHRCSL